MVAVSATLYGAQAPPMVVVTVTGVAGKVRVDLWREPPNEPAALVRGGVGLVPDAADTLLILDTEPELGRPLVYVAHVVNPGGTLTQTSAAVAIVVPDPGRHVLSSSFSGRAVLVDLIATPDDRAQDAAGSFLRPRGRRRGVAIHDVRSDDSGELVVHTRTRVETLDLEDLLADGAPVVSRHPFDGCDVAGREVLYVERASRARRDRTGSRVWVLPFHVVDTPDPALATAMPTLQSLADYVPGTLQDIADGWPTLLDLARHDLGTL